MVPASLARGAHGSRGRVDDLGIRDRWWRPANIPFTVRAQLRTLVVSGAILWVLGIGLLLGYVWVRLKVVEAGYQTSATRQLVERLLREGRELQVLAAAVDTPERIAEMAEERLGMRRPRRGEEARLP